MKPLIIFTDLDSQGNLIKDEVRTQYYAEHPDELAALSARMNLSRVELKLVEKGTDEFEELLKTFTDGKTERMLIAENIMLAANMKIPKTTDKRYLNTLCQQIMILMQNNKTASQVFKLCNVDFEATDWMQQILNACISREVLFDE